MSSIPEGRCQEGDQRDWIKGGPGFVLRRREESGGAGSQQHYNRTKGKQMLNQNERDTRDIMSGGTVGEREGEEDTDSPGCVDISQTWSLNRPWVLNH